MKYRVLYIVYNFKPLPDEFNADYFAEHQIL